jgi:hypothetical protein
MLQTSKQNPKMAGSGGWQLAGNFCHQRCHAWILTNGRLDVELGVRIGGAQLFHQQRQILACVFARAQEHRHDGDLRSTLVHRLGDRLWQRGRTKFEVCAQHRPMGRPVGDPGGHGVHGSAPQRIARTVGKKNDGLFHGGSVGSASPPEYQPAKGGQRKH